MFQKEPKTRQISCIQRLTKNEELTPKCMETIRRIQDNEIGSDMELIKVKGYKVFSARFGRKPRLLFAEVDGEMTLMAVMRDHNYDYYLRPEFLKPFSETVRREREEGTLEFIPCAPEDRPVFKKNEGKIEYIPVEYYQHKMIRIGEDQQQIIAAGPGSKVVTGVPGGGKTFILHELLAQSENMKVLVVTKFPELLDKLKTDYCSMIGVNPNNVTFATIETVLREKAVETKDLDFVGKEHFLVWLKTHIKKFSKSFTNPIKEADISAIYEECKFIAGLPKNKIPDLGRSSRQFTEAKDLAGLKLISDAYIQFLKTDKKVNPAFFTRLLKREYALGLADEADKFSPLELSLIIQMCENQYFFMDTNQSMEENALIRQMLLFRMELGGAKEITQMHLPTSYRFSKKAAEPVNRWMNMINGLLEKDKYAAKQIDVASNLEYADEFIIFESNIKNLDLSSLNKMVNSGQIKFGIVPDKNAEKHKAALRKYFPKLPLTTISRMAGLEGCAISFNLMDSEEFRSLNKLLLLKQNPDIPYKKVTEERLCAAAAQITVALTRTTKSNVFIQEDLHGLEAIWECLKGIEPQVAPKLPEVKITTIEEWYETVNSYIKKNHMDLAEETFNFNIEPQLKIKGTFKDYEAYFNNKSPKKDSFEDYLDRQRQPVAAAAPTPVPTLKKSRHKPPQKCVDTTVKKSHSEPKPVAKQSVTVSNQSLFDHSLAEKKLRNYIDSFLTETTELKLKKLFDSIGADNHKLNSYLFEKGFCGATLFRILMEWRVFFEFLNNSTGFINRINGNLILNVLTPDFIGNTQSHFFKCFLLLLEKHDTLESFITVDFLFSKHGTDERCMVDIMNNIFDRARFNLPEQEKFLSILTKKNPRRWHDPRFIHYIRLNPHYLTFFVQRENGCNIISELLNTVDNFLSVNDIFNMINTKQFFLILTATPYGLRTFSLMLKKIPDFCQSITWDHLNSFDDSINAFINLIGVKAGLALSFKILTENAKMRKSIELKDLLKEYKNDAWESSINDILQESAEGRILLELIASENPEISHSAACFPEKLPALLANKTVKQFASIFLDVMTSSIGREKACEYFQCGNPMPDEMLKNLIDELFERISLLKIFAEYENSFNLLLFWSQKDPIFVRLFQKIVNHPSAHECIYLLSKPPYGIVLLDRMFRENSESLTLLRYDMFKFSRTEQPSGRIKSTLQNLQCNKGQILIQFLIEKNPALEKEGLSTLESQFKSNFEWLMVPANMNYKDCCPPVIKSMLALINLKDGAEIVNKIFLTYFATKPLRGWNSVQGFYVRRIAHMFTYSLMEHSSLFIVLTKEKKYLPLLKTLMNNREFLIQHVMEFVKNDYDIIYYLLQNQETYVKLFDMLFGNYNMVINFRESVFMKCYTDPDNHQQTKPLVKLIYQFQEKYRAAGISENMYEFLLMGPGFKSAAEKYKLPLLSGTGRENLIRIR